jgi:hypothetical protein
MWSLKHNTRGSVRRCGRFGVVAALLLTCAALLAPGAAHAANVLDQQQPTTSRSYYDIKGPTAFGGNGPILMAQTFRAGITGTLDRVDLAITRDTAPLTVSIQTATSAGVPSGTVLASTAISFASPYGLPAWQALAFQSPAEIQAGTEYAIVARTMGAGFWGWAYGSGGYANGAAYQSLTDPPSWRQVGPDLSFKTYVTPTSTQARRIRCAS